MSDLLNYIRKNKFITEEFKNSFIFDNLNENSGATIRKINQFFDYAKFEKNSMAQELQDNKISSIPPSGIVISKPGTYEFTNNIDWRPNGPLLTAITISSSDVTLDLKGFNLNCIDPSLAYPLPTGIHVAGSIIGQLQNVKILNGKINNMGLFGIFCEVSNTIEINRVTIVGLKNENLNIAPYGIYMLECEEVVLSKITVRDIDIQGRNLSGIQLSLTNNAQVSNCKLKNIVNRSGACVGIGYFACNNVKTLNTGFDGLQTFDIPNPVAEGHTCIAIVDILSSNMHYESCNIKNVQGSCDDAHGISIFISFVNTVIKDCKIRNVSTGKVGALSAKSTGIEILGAINVEIVDCSASYISAINPGDKQCAGFSNGLSQDVKFVRCSARHVNCYNNNLKQESAVGFGIGFGWAPDPRPQFVGPAVNAQYISCSVTYSQVGFDTWYHQNSIWENLKANYNGINIMDLNCSQRVLTCDECSECSPPTFIILSNIARGNEILKSNKIKYDSNNLC